MSSAASDGSKAPDWARIDAALDVLIGLTGEQRDEAIERIAGRDHPFAAELRSLAARLEGDDALLDHPASDVLAVGTEMEPGLIAGTRLGSWRIVSLIGRGGMGEVYRAERADDQFEQVAAVKLIRVDTAPRLARFQSERQILARLEHPGIARLLDGGVSDNGRPFMVMELVGGRHITDWCREHDASLEQRLALFMEICDAVAYAHRNLIVHRDLKPANVLVTGEGHTKLLDFGVARLLETPAGEVTRELLVTPGYASPEQLTGEPITTAADVHALGLLLYELLTDRPAFDVQSLPLAAAMQRIITQPASPPSRVAGALAQPAVPARRLAGDLDAIVEKALRKEPRARYASVDELRADVERHLRAEPVLALSGNRTYRLRKFLARRWLPVSAAVVTTVALLAGTGLALWQARRAQVQEAKALAVQEFLLGLFRANSDSQPDPMRARATTARELLDIGAAQARTQLNETPEVKDTLLSTLSSLYVDVGLDEEAAQLAGERVALREKLYGPDDPRTADALLQQADAIDSTHGAKQESKLLEHARRIVDRMTPVDNALKLHVAISQANVSRYVDVSASLGYVKEARALITRSNAGDDARRNVTYLEGLDLTFLGACADAMAPLEEAHRITLAKDPPIPRWQITEDTAIAGAAACVADFVHAEAMLNEALDISRRLNGPQHIDTQHVLLRQMRVYRDTSRATQARDIQLTLRTLLEDPVVQGNGNLNATMLAAAALQAWETGRLDEADDLSARNVLAHLNKTGASLVLARAMELRARVLTTEGRLDQAARDLDEALAMMRQALGARAAPAALAQLRIDRAAVDLLAGRADAALAGLDAVAAELPTAAPESRPIAPLIARWRAAALRASGRTAEAAAAADSALRAMALWARPDDLPQLRADLLLERGLALLRLDRNPEAEDALATALALRSANDDSRSLWLACVEIARAESMLAQGDRRGARRLFDQAREGMRHYARLAPFFSEQLDRLSAKLDSGR